VQLSTHYHVSLCTVFFFNIGHADLLLLSSLSESRVSVVGIMTRLSSRYPRHRGLIPSKGKIFFPSSNTHTACWAHSSSCSTRTGSKAVRASAEGKNQWSHTPASPPHAVMACTGTTLYLPSVVILVNPIYNCRHLVGKTAVCRQCFMIQDISL
jgi:hypothetical protein